MCLVVTRAESKDLLQLQTYRLCSGVLQKMELLCKLPSISSRSTVISHLLNFFYNSGFTDLSVYVLGNLILDLQIVPAVVTHAMSW